MKSKYDEQAEEFATKYGLVLEVIGKPKYRKYFPGDTSDRYVFNMRMTRNGEVYDFQFGQSLANFDIEPTLYDVLSSITKFRPENLEDFCIEYALDYYDIKSVDLYNAVMKEFLAVHRLFPEENVLNELREIQ